MNLAVENTLAHISQEIKLRCEHNGRKYQDVKIVAVSKLQPVGKVRKLYELGQKIFAENYVQEALAKQIALHDLPLEWHLIGHIQRKKINSIIKRNTKSETGQFTLIHSIDSLDLAQSISRKCEAEKMKQKILLQVNVAGELSKEGWAIDELKTQWALLTELPGIQIEGFMTMPPLSDDTETSRKYFRKLRLLRDEMQNSKIQLRELSMGTSQDYLVAVDEGATLIRIGTRLFGERALA